MGTLIIMTHQVSLVYVQVVICVQLPELTVDDIEMFIREELCQLVDLFLFFQKCHILLGNIFTITQRKSQPDFRKIYSRNPKTTLFSTKSYYLKPTIIILNQQLYWFS